VPPASSRWRHSSAVAPFVYWAPFVYGVPFVYWVPFVLWGAVRLLGGARVRRWRGIDTVAPSPVEVMEALERGKAKPSD
jgi:hypothetical protein